MSTLDIGGGDLQPGRRSVWATPNQAPPESLHAPIHIAHLLHLHILPILACPSTVMIPTGEPKHIQQRRVMSTPTIRHQRRRCLTPKPPTPASPQAGCRIPLAHAHPTSDPQPRFTLQERTHPIATAFIAWLFFPGCRYTSTERQSDRHSSDNLPAIPAQVSERARLPGVTTPTPYPPSPLSPVPRC